jgi:hypothetical protein
VSAANYDDLYPSYSVISSEAVGVEMRRALVTVSNPKHGHHRLPSFSSNAESPPWEKTTTPDLTVVAEAMLLVVMVAIMME